MQEGVNAVNFFNREKDEEDLERVKHCVLEVGDQRDAAEFVRIPQRKRALVKKREERIVEQAIVGARRDVAAD